MQAANSSELDAVWRSHSDELVRFATLMSSPTDAVDIVSDAFLRFERHAAGISEPRSYLFTAVRSVAIDRARSERQRRRRELRLASDEANAESDGPDPAVIRAVARLSPQQRAVTYFAYWQDMTEPEIAELIGVSAGSVRRQLARARAHLRKELA